MTITFRDKKPDRERIEFLKKHWGLGTASAVIRKGLEVLVRNIKKLKEFNGG